MDIRKNPPTYKPRQLRRTPAWGYLNKLSFAVLSVCSLVGAGMYYGPLLRVTHEKIVNSEYYNTSERSKVSGFRMFMPITSYSTYEEVFMSEED